MDLNFEDCRDIAEKYLGTKDFEVLDYNVKITDEASMGLIAAASRLFLNVRTCEEVKTLRFFYKSLPENPVHFETVKRIGCFIKEADFFNKINSQVSKYQTIHSVPKCYLADENKGIVLEDLTLLNYKNFPLTKCFDLEHCKVALKALADIHASSIIYEEQSGSSIEEQFSQSMFISWFAEDESHPGNKHMHTGIRAINAVLHKHFKQISPAVREEIISICKKLPVLIRPSNKSKNALSHNDLWCNNIMFNYQGDVVKEACIIDFQLFAYNPPSLDILVLLYTNTDKSFRVKHLSYLLKFYHDTFTQFIKGHNYNSNDILSLDDFEKSIVEVQLTALVSAVLYLQFVLLPEKELMKIMSDTVKIKPFLEVDRNDFVLNAIETDLTYRTRLFEALWDLIDCVTKHI